MRLIYASHIAFHITALTKKKIMSGKKQTTLSYDTSLEELQRIVEDIENESIGVDALSEKVKRAPELVQFCQAKRRQTEQDISQTLTKLE